MTTLKRSERPPAIPGTSKRLQRPSRDSATSFHRQTSSRSWSSGLAFVLIPIAEGRNDSLGSTSHWTEYRVFRRRSSPAAISRWLAGAKFDALGCVLERVGYDEVSVDADGAQVEDGRRAQHHVERRPDVTQLLTE